MLPPSLPPDDSGTQAREAMKEREGTRRKEDGRLEANKGKQSPE